MKVSDFDQYIHRFQNMPPFTIYHPTPDKDDVVEWHQVSQATVLPELVINQVNIPAQVDLCAAQIQTWGRYKSIAQRAVDIIQRRYRVWRDGWKLHMIEAAESSGDKKPTEKGLEMLSRQQKEYAEHYRRIEESEEALAAVESIYEAFRVKANLLGAHSPMYREMAR
jgi:hypothetical protein